MHSRFTRGPEQTRGQDPTRLEETPEETREDQEEEILEEAVLETHSQADSWQEEEPKLERRAPYPLSSMGTAPKQGCSSEP